MLQNGTILYIKLPIVTYSSIVVRIVFYCLSKCAGFSSLLVLLYILIPGE